MGATVATKLLELIEVLEAAVPEAMAARAEYQRRG
jgi:hypothetical protein